MATAQGIRAGKAYVELGVFSDNLNKGLEEAKGKVEGFAKGAANVLGAAAVASAPLVMATKIFSSFDDQMRLVQAVSGSTAKEFEALTNKAKELGATTSWTAAQVASAMVGLGRAGFSATEINDAITGVMNLARATGTEIEPATDIAGAALRAFGLDASQMSKVCDVLTATANGSAQTLNDLGDSFKYIAPIAAQAGATLEDTAKLVGALANFGIKGSQAGTVLKNIQVKMATDANAQAQYQELGIDTTDAQGNLRKVGDVIAELGRKIADLPSAEKLKIINTLFGQEGITGVSLTAASFDELNAAIDNAAGKADATAKTMDEGLGGAVRITQSAVEALALAIGNSLSPYFIELAGYIQEAAGKLQAWTDENPNAIKNAVELGLKVAATAAAIALACKATTTLITVTKILTTVYNGAARIIDIFVGATKAAQAAEAAKVLTAQTLVKVQASVNAVNTATSASAKAAATAELALATAEARGAIAAESAATAQAAAAASTAALTLTITAVVAVITAAVYAFNRYATAAERAAKKAGEASEKAKELSEANSNKRVQDAQLFEQLKELANKQELTNEEFARAENIVKALQQRYGNLGITCDSTSKKINGMAQAQLNFNKALKQQELQEAQKELTAKQRELDAYKREQKKFGYDTGKTTVGGIWKDAKSFFGGESWEEGRIRNKNNLANTGQDIALLQQRIEAIKNEQNGLNLDAVAQTAAETAAKQTQDQETPNDNSVFDKLADEADIAYQKELEEQDKDDIVQAATETASSSTFNAFEALDFANDWQKTEAKAQTKELETQTDELKRLNKTLYDYVSFNDETYV